MPSFSFIPIVYANILQNFTLHIAPATNQINGFGQKAYETWRTTQSTYLRKNSNISNETAEMVNFHFSHYKSMGTISCYSNQSYVTGIKKAIYVEASVINMYA